ncbi:MAG: ABC transporter permease [Lactobacillaceae bacterium]|jgi:peptide/nickel transport system permease protein|nr:ABC transporter permease [Lactobacillaceae bacterium]
MKNTNVELEAKEKVSFLSNLKREFKKDKAGLFSLILVSVLLIFIFVYAILIKTGDFVNVNIMDQYLTPFSSTVNEAGKSIFHILGTDDGGRDEFKLLVVAARNSLFIAIAYTIITQLIGLLVGLISAYNGGIVDWLIMRFIEFLALIPTLMAVMVFVTIIPKYTPITLILVFTAVTWFANVRFVRSNALAQVNMDYVKAAKLSGASPFRIMFKEILPNMSSLIIADATLSLAGNIGLEVGLAFLGFGLPAASPSLGTLLNLATDPENMTDRLWVWLPSAVLIVLFTISIVTIGQTIRRAADQRQSLS